jgi:DNA polymerase-3 subunit beta
MKCQINKDVILEGLQKVQSIVGTRTTLPILYNVLFKAEKDRVWLTATDLEVSVRTSVDAKVSRTGGTTLPARRIFSIFRELPANEIEIDVNEKDEASIRCGTAFFKIKGLSEDEFPPLPKYQGNRSYTLPQELFKKMLLCTHFAASSDETRYILNGVLLSFRGDKLVVVATDGRRMAMFEQEMDFAKDAEGDWVVPSKTVRELIGNLRDEGNIKIMVTDNQIAFDFDNILVVSKLIEGTFPNFMQVVPPTSAEHVNVEREKLLDAIRRVALLASDKTNSVTLRFAKNKIEISTLSPEVGEAKEEVALKYSGKEQSIAFNPEFLMDPLKNLTCDEVAFEFTDELTAGLIKADKPFVYVIMPMRIR